MATLDCIVLGTGTMGAAACAELARRGRRVLGIDRSSPPHDRGSHHGVTRLFRKAYFEHPDYVPLLHRAEALWERANQGSAEILFRRTGAIYAGPDRGVLIPGTLESARRHRLPVEELSARAVAARFPALRIAPGHRCLLDHDGAVIMCERAIEHFLGVARGAGAELRAGEAVLSWVERDDGVVVTTEAGEYAARTLVVTCGAWAASSMGSLGERLVVTRQVLGWIRPSEPEAFSAERFPVWAAENPDGSLYYGAPVMPGEQGVKIARHARGAPTDPNRVDREVRAEDLDEIMAGADLHLRGVVREVVEARVCLYTNSPDSHFVVGRLPGAARVFLAAGFSGHGFKFMPVIGEVLADLAESGRTRHPIDLFSPERFGR